MAVRLLLLFMTGLVLSEERPDVDCLVVNLDYVHCMWHGSAAPDVNYTFYSRFDREAFKACARYVLENSMVVGCDHPYQNLLVKRSSRFTTKLLLLNRSVEQTFDLATKVKLNAPSNLTVKLGTDSNLWFYWNDSHIIDCVGSQVRHRIEGKEWKNIPLFIQKGSYCINLPSKSSRYELQARSNIDNNCRASDYWSDWSPSVFWGPVSNSTGTGLLSNSMAAWIPVLWVLGLSVIALLLVAIFVQHERLRVILIPILPDPGKKLVKILADGNVEDWLPISKGIKEGFKANYSERACSVREYSCVPEAARESSMEQCSSDQSSGSYASSVTTDQTNCSLSVNEPAGPTSCYRNISTSPVSCVETQGAG